MGYCRLSRKKQDGPELKSVSYSQYEWIYQSFSCSKEQNPNCENKKKLKTKSFPLVLSHSFGNTLVPNSIKWLKKTFPVISFDDFFLA